MNDETDKQDETQAKEEGPEFPAGFHPDLGWLISNANDGRMPANSPVTVWVKGIQFAGQIASDKEGQRTFIKTWSDGVKNATFGPGLAPEAVDAARRGIRESVDKNTPRMLEELEKLPPPKRHDFLTLKKARVWHPGGRGPTHVELVRIRLDQIDAFTLGEPNED